MHAQRTHARTSGCGRPRDGGLGEARVAAMVRAHGNALQRALEIYLRRLARVEPATELAWLT